MRDSFPSLVCYRIPAVIPGHRVARHQRALTQSSFNEDVEQMRMNMSHHSTHSSSIQFTPPTPSPSPQPSPQTSPIQVNSNSQIQAPPTLISLDVPPMITRDTFTTPIIPVQATHRSTSQPDNSRNIRRPLTSTKPTYPLSPLSVMFIQNQRMLNEIHQRRSAMWAEHRRRQWSTMEQQQQMWQNSMMQTVQAQSSVTNISNTSALTAQV